MAHIEDDFAAYTTIGDRVAPPSSSAVKQSSSAPQGPKFGVPAKLEPFTLLAKSARGAGAANLISQAVSAPGVYVFSELLQLSSIKDLATNDQHAAQYRLLELFAYGTWNDYTTARDQYPTLTPEQETKLKQLTILSLASETRILPYSKLLSSLSIESVPLLEDLLIESIYSNILTGRLDQLSSQLEAVSSLGRDVKPSTSSNAIEESMELDATSTPPSNSGVVAPTVSSLLSSLHDWSCKIDQLLNSLDQHISTLNANSINQSKESMRHEHKVREMVQEVSKGKNSSSKKSGDQGSGQGWKDVGGSGGGKGDGDMDVDVPPPLTSTGGVTRSAISPASAGGGSGSGMGGRLRKRGRT
ncbi:hypothetical protein JCM5353_002854 [Sporobolomyces roseus]